MGHCVLLVLLSCPLLACFYPCRRASRAASRPVVSSSCVRRLVLACRPVVLSSRRRASRRPASVVVSSCVLSCLSWDGAVVLCDETRVVSWDRGMIGNGVRLFVVLVLLACPHCPP